MYIGGILEMANARPSGGFRDRLPREENPIDAEG
jgi:hypothetical protein